MDDLHRWLPWIVGTIFHAFTAGVVYGRLSQRVKDIEKTQESNAGWMLQASELMRRLSISVAVLESKSKPNGAAAGRA